MKKNIFITIAALASLTIACNKTSEFGSDIVGSDKLNFVFTDTLQVLAATERLDSIPMFTGATDYPYFPYLPLGDVSDATFGKTKSTIYANFDFGSTKPLIDSVASKNILDSVVLVLDYDQTYFYGDTTNEQLVKVRRLNDILPSGIKPYSNQSYAASTELGSKRFKPQPNTTVIYSASGTDTSYLTPRVSIPLDAAFGRQLLDRSTYDLEGGDITRWFKGFEIEAAQNSKCMMSVDIEGGGTGIYLYYRIQGDTTRKLYVFKPKPTTPHYAKYQNDYAQGVIRFNGNDATTDSVLYVQGLSGTNVKIEFPTLKNLGKAAINRAELEFTVKTDQTDVFPPLSQLVLMTGSGRLVNDLLLNGSANITDYLPGFGGKPVLESGGVWRYRLNFTAHIQEMLEGGAGNVLYLIPLSKQYTTGRTILYGTKHPQYRAKLNVYYTKL